MSPARRRQMVDREHPSLSLVRQCTLLGISRSSVYYRRWVASQDDLSLMGGDRPAVPGDALLWVKADEGLVGAAGEPPRSLRQVTQIGDGGGALRTELVSRKRVQRLVRAMGLRAIYRRPGTSRRSPEHPVYPYLLRNVRITRPNQV